MKWYKYNIQDLSTAEYKKWYSLMSLEKKQRVDRFRFTDDKKRTVMGEMLARKAIAEWCHVSVEEIQFGLSEYGKPFAIGLDVEFNISHSGNMVVCAVDNKPVGIDIEQIRPMDLNVARRICTEKEIAYIFADNLREDEFCKITDFKILTRFFEVWTLKEAYGKYIGTGMMDLKKLKKKNVWEWGKTFLCDNYIVGIYKEERDINDV